MKLFVVLSKYFRKSFFRIFIQELINLWCFSIFKTKKIITIKHRKTNLAVFSEYFEKLKEIKKNQNIFSISMKLSTNYLYQIFI